MKKVYLISIVLHIFIGIGAIFGGLAAILNPKNPMGMSSDILIGSPFKDFLIPGLFLFTVIGLGNLIVGFLYRFKLWFQGYLSGMMGGILALWIIIQCVILKAVVMLHVIFFLLGITQGILALIILYFKKLFPMNLKIIKKK